MTITVQQIAQSQEILGSHVQHLAKNPRDFLALVKLDIELATRYAQAFSAGHALTLFSNAQAQGIRLATEIFALDPYGIAIRNDSLNFSSVSTDLIDGYIDEMSKKCVFTMTSIGGIESDDTYTCSYGKSVLRQYSQYSWEDVRGPYQYYIANIETAYKHFRHPGWVINQKNRLMTGLLSKLDSTVYITDKNGQQSGILDAEFAQQSGFSRLYSRADNLFDHLIANQSPELMGKVASLLSPILAMRELQKPRAGKQTVMECVIDHIPTANQPAVEVINKMNDLPERFFDSAMAGFQFDVLGAIASKCQNLAQRFYELAPGLMQRQYPKSAEQFMVDAPPPYEKPSAYNPEFC